VVQGGKGRGGDARLRWLPLLHGKLDVVAPPPIAAEFASMRKPAKRPGDLELGAALLLIAHLLKSPKQPN
jgi:hypothetical protein